jgi:hypothetical protein
MDVSFSCPQGGEHFAADANNESLRIMHVTLSEWRNSLSFTFAGLRGRTGLDEAFTIRHPELSFAGC